MSVAVVGFGTDSQMCLGPLGRSPPGRGAGRARRTLWWGAGRRGLVSGAVGGFGADSQMCLGTIGRSPPGRIVKVGAASVKFSFTVSGSITSADWNTGYSHTWWL